MADTEKYKQFASVVLDLAIAKPLDYGIPEALTPLIKRGVHVKVTVRGKARHGYVVSTQSSSPYPRVMPIESVLSQGELITEDLFSLACWMSKYYCAPLGQVLKIILPSSVREDVAHVEQYYVLRAKSKEVLRKELEELYTTNPSQAKVLEVMLTTTKGILLSELLEKTQVSKSPVDTLVKKGLLLVDIVRVDRSPLIAEEYFKTTAKPLGSEQKLAYDKLIAGLESNVFETHLLHGVTGSGKTEVYLQAIERALQLGKGTIMLVPEISLTPQTIQRFRSRFEGKIAILHHRLSKGERYDEWHKIHRGEASIVIGARSALFCPVRNLGLIIVDEEHDGAYKQQEESPCYNARDVAVVRGKLSNSIVILGSATPSLESYFNALTGKYILSPLNIRADGAQMPVVTLVDMKREDEKVKRFTSFSDPLISALKKRIERGEQAILFLNRRGYFTTLLCLGCGHTLKCPDCEIALTFHLGENTLACHLCDYRLTPPPACCPGCNRNETLKFKGVGTEQIETALKALIPDVRTLRIDRDTTRHKGSHEQLFREFSTGKYDVLIGTQMIAKGLHFPGVTLVALLNADSGLNIPDFRASEHVFSLITQVSGRAGRGETPGEVLIQTRLPENPIIQMGLKQDFASFYSSEIEVRKIFGYPPYSHLFKISFHGENPELTEKTGIQFRALLQPNLSADYSLHPLLPAGHPKIKNIYRFQFLIRGPHVYPVTEAISAALTNLASSKDVRILVDVDPLSTFF